MTVSSLPGFGPVALILSCRILQLCPIQSDWIISPNLLKVQRNV
jgi:hypothetical protein